MIRIVRNDFTLPHYDIIHNGDTTFEEYINFNKDEIIEVNTLNGTLGRLVEVKCGDKVASFWADDVPEWYPVIKSNTKPKI